MHGRARHAAFRCSDDHTYETFEIVTPMNSWVLESAEEDGSFVYLIRKAEP